MFTVVMKTLSAFLTKISHDVKPLFVGLCTIISCFILDCIVPCGQGYYYKGSTAPAKCEPCPFNTYQDGSGRSSCKKCPEGTYTNKQGSKFADSCLSEYVSMCDILMISLCYTCHTVLR